MAVLNSKFDILRGWPNGSAVAIDVGMESGGTHSFRAGTFVKLIDDNGTAIAGNDPDDVDAALAANGSSAGLRGLGLIIEGLEETSAAMSKTVTVLVGGGFVARFHLEASMTKNAFGSASIPNGVDQFAAANMAGGEAVTIVNSKVVHCDLTNAASPPAVGTVLAYDSANGTLDVLFH